MSSNVLALTPIQGEPRIHDLLLAERLGFSQPRDIRKLIKRNTTKLLKFGGCATVARVVKGNETSEYYLNQKQSIWVCMKSETEQAFDVQVEIVRVFDAYLTRVPDDDTPPEPERDLSDDIPDDDWDESIEYLETDAGQSLMAEAHRMAAESRRYTARMSRREADRA